MRLIWKLTFLALIATFFSMVVFIIFSSYKSASYIKTIVSDELVMDATFYSDEVDHMIEMRLEDARTLAASPVFKSGSSEDLDNYLRYISSGSMWIQEIAFFDADWNLVSWPEKLEPKTFSMRSVINVNNDFINEIKKTGLQKIFAIDDAKNNLPALIVVTPVYTNDNPKYPYGFLALNLDFKCILGCTGFFHHANKNNRSFYVLDQKNRVIASINGVNETGEVFKDIEGYRALSNINEDKEVIEYQSHENGETYLGTVAYLENLSNENNIEWKVALVSPMESVMSPVKSLAKVHVSLGIAVTLFSILMSFILARSLTGPLNRIISMAAKMRAGDYQARIPLETMSSEFELLTTTLNSMAEKVDERTTELIETNEKLIEEVKNHRDTRDALEGEEERFRLMVENLPLGSIYIENGHIYLNRAAEEITGYSRNEISTTSGFLENVILTKSEIEIYETKDLMSVNAFHGWKPCQINTKSGDTRYAELKAYRFEKGEVYILKDITEQIESEREKEDMQQQLYQAQKMEAIGQLAGGMAHDFNNMIGVIIGSASMALMDITEDAPGYKELKNIVEASRRARELSSKILTFARKEKVVVISASPVEVVEASMNMFKRAMPTEISIGMSYHDDVPNVLIDAMQIEQVLINLFRNSCDAMPDGGSIVINVREVDPENDDVQLPPDTRYCVLEVSDTGGGMPKEVASRIFEPFFTTKKAGKGTGLGLSVTMGIIRNHNGFIDVKSEEGVGTTISIYLPIDTEWKPEISVSENNSEDSGFNEVEPVSTVENVPAFRVKKEKILVVDDEQMMKEVTVAILQSSGFRVISAANGNEALEVFNKRKNEIALIVLDIMMPVMDGIQAFLKLREIEPEIPIVFVSGYVEESYLMENAPEMVDYFVHKPYENDELLCKITSVMEAAHATG